VLLALDTSTPSVTAALHDGHRLLAESTVVDARRHGELLTPAIERVLAAARIAPGAVTRIAVGVGPGPFTGLRVGVVTALTMGCALGVPVVGVCSLDALAFAALAGVPTGAPTRQAFAIVTDARRREVYWATYDPGGARRSGPAVDHPEVVAAELSATGMPVLGPATDLFAFERVLPGGPLSAGALAAAVVTGSAELLPVRPLYLRRPDATPPARPKTARA
jgi:tRNA threonylcarbamoyl adenosine modification protein YeaZ